jgi:hypothetical protein
MEVLKMQCPECNDGEIFAYVFTCHKHVVALEGEIGDPIDTADDVRNIPKDYAECDSCGSVFPVGGDQVYDAL